MRRVVFLLACLLLLAHLHAATGAQDNDFELLTANQGTVLSISYSMACGPGLHVLLSLNPKRQPVVIE